MEYQIILDIFGVIILSATFALCLRSFRREDHERAQPLPGAIVAQPLPGAIVAQPLPGAIVAQPLPGAIAAQQSLAELLNLMDESVGRTVRIAPPRDAIDDIEVTVRVNKKHGFAAAATIGSTEIVNAAWEPLAPEARHGVLLEGSEITRCHDRESKRSAGLIRS